MESVLQVLRQEGRTMDSPLVELTVLALHHGGCSDVNLTPPQFFHL